MAPAFALLPPDSAERARLVTLRQAVEPLLATNYLSHFTDHSVTHSDHICTLVDQLASPLVQRPLTNIEAFILYAACYYHDAGMQHQRADQTQVVIAEFSKGQEFDGRTWEALPRDAQQDLVRRVHHRLSSELVHLSAVSLPPPLGMVLNDDDHPGLVAALCVAHALNLPDEAAEYASRTANSGGLRMGLLAALLRTADILDESRRRSRLFLERTRDLPLESRMHWWRHYYVFRVEIAPPTVNIWFDFPSNRRAQYSELIVPLQLLQLQDEFGRHATTWADEGLAWHLAERHVDPFQSSSRPMDGDLERFAIEQSVARRQAQLLRERHDTVRQLKLARPTIAREFAEMRSSTEPPPALLKRALDLSEHLQRLGGLREAWTFLHAEVSRLGQTMQQPVPLSVVLRLAEMILADNAHEQVASTLHPFLGRFNNLSDNDPVKLKFLHLWALAMRYKCDIQSAEEAYNRLLTAAPNGQTRDIAAAELLEMHLLQGSLEKLTDSESSRC